MTSETSTHDLLVKEYFHIQDTIESFDSKALTIKAWSVTLSMAGVGTAYVEDKHEVLLLASFSGLLFWLIEGLWKTFQYAYYARIYEIEKHFAEETTGLATPRISTSWLQSWRRGGRTRLVKVLLWPHVLLPHAAVFIGGIILYVLPIIHQYVCAACYQQQHLRFDWIV